MFRLLLGAVADQATPGQQIKQFVFTVISRCPVARLHGDNNPIQVFHLTKSHEVIRQCWAVMLNLALYICSSVFLSRRRQTPLILKLSGAEMKEGQKRSHTQQQQQQQLQADQKKTVLKNTTSLHLCYSAAVHAHNSATENEWELRFLFFRY